MSNNKLFFGIFVVSLLFSSLISAAEPWEYKLGHIGVVIDAGHSLYGDTDPQSSNISSKDFLKYQPAPGTGEGGRSCINVTNLANGAVQEINCGKYLQLSKDGKTEVVTIRDSNDYVEPEGTAFFARALYEELLPYSVSNHPFANNEYMRLESTRDLSYSFDRMLSSVRQPNTGNDWRSGATTYLCYMKQTYCGPFKKPNPKGGDYDISIRYQYANDLQKNDKSRDYVFISYHSDATPNKSNLKPSGTTVFYSTAKTPNSKKYFATFIRDEIIPDLNKELGAGWSDRSSNLQTASYGVIRETDIPSTLIEIGFHTNYNNVKTLLAYDQLQPKRTVAKASFDGIKKYFNAGVQTFRETGLTTNTFTTNDKIFVWGTGYPQKYDVTIYVVPHKNYDNYKRDVAFSSLGVKKKNVSKTDILGEVPKTAIINPNTLPAGEYDVIVAIYDKDKFQWVDAYSTFSIVKTISVDATKADSSEYLGSGTKSSTVKTGSVASASNTSYQKAAEKLNSSTANYGAYNASKFPELFKYGKDKNQNLMTALKSISGSFKAQGTTMTPELLAAVMATLEKEVGGSFLPVEEIGDYGMGPKCSYKISGKCRSTPYDGGVDYKGRGYIQITHKYNYEKYCGADCVTASSNVTTSVCGCKNKKYCTVTDLVACPQAKALNPTTAAKIFASFYGSVTSDGKNLIALSNAKNYYAVGKKINGGTSYGNDFGVKGKKYMAIFSKSQNKTTALIEYLNN
ncbi:N-acetylmuramoyl-L-alanine amidase [Candidatus Micrarchaeota archaeon]|nr:N-acetylmuramoyl-L-alanine amidase [Candidatus Micrarchaeota archaeon]